MLTHPKGLYVLFFTELWERYSFYSMVAILSLYMNERLHFFYTGLVLLACGSGLLKPNVSTLAGNLYRDQPQLRDQGFNIYYMGVNIGAFVAQLFVSVLRFRYGWSIAFMSAAVAMFFSLVTFIGFNRHVAGAAVKVD